MNLTFIHKPDSESYYLLKCLLLPDDLQWTKQLQNIPTITFNTIYDFLVDRKILLKKVSHLESATNDKEQMSNDEEGSCQDEKNHGMNSLNICVPWTRLAVF